MTTEFNWTQFATDHPEAMKPILDALGWELEHTYFYRDGWDHYNDCDGQESIDSQDVPALIEHTIEAMVLGAGGQIDCCIIQGEPMEYCIIDGDGGNQTTGDTLSQALAAWLESRGV